MEDQLIIESLNETYFSEQCDEFEIIKELDNIWKNTRIFVDIGASLGQYSFYANEAMNKGEIIAIEADPIRFKELIKNCEKWENTSNNKISAMYSAISDSDGDVSFFITNSPVSGGLFQHELSHLKEKSKKNVIWEKITVNSYKLDTLFKEKIPDFIKIDVEGGELRVLKGSINLLKRGKTKFLIEIHSWVDPNGQKCSGDVFEFMKKFDYYPFDMKGRCFFRKLNFLEKILYKLHILSSFKLSCH